MFFGMWYTYLMRRYTEFVTGEIYHIFNRGAGKCIIFKDAVDYYRFLLNMVAFNSIEPIGSLWEHSFVKAQDVKVKEEPLVEIIADCLNPNHFHIRVRQLVDNGISEYMKKIQAGYTQHFNNRNERVGTLYQGRFKAVHVATDRQLQHLSVYINFNSQAHGLGEPIPHVRSSWYEYIGKSEKDMCQKGIILDSYDNMEDYKKFAESTLEDIIKTKESNKQLIEEGGKPMNLE